MSEDEVHIVWGQDLLHCLDHCYEEQGVERWRCLAPDHVEYPKCSEDFLHCKTCYKVIDNPDGNTEYCEEHS